MRWQGLAGGRLVATVSRRWAALLATVAAVAMGHAAPAAAKPPKSKPAARKTAAEPASEATEPPSGSGAPSNGDDSAAEQGTPRSERPAVEQSALQADPTRLGPFQPPPRPFPFPLLGDDRATEVFVDRAGNLYKERHYSGNVPDWSGEPPSALSGRCKVEPQALQWIGFQNNADGSRVYVQLENQACGYVYRPDDRHIVIDLPQVTVSSQNFLREILTGAFPTAIEQVRAEELAGRGTRVVVVLREPRPYLSAHLGKYLFVDVTR